MIHGVLRTYASQPAAVRAVTDAAGAASGRRVRGRARVAGLVCLLALAAGCEQTDKPLVGRPGGPYRLTLALDPAAPQPGEQVQLEFALSYATDGRPVRDLQIAHERLLHTFIVDLDFRTFAHIHHEDFAPLTEADRAAARVRFPYRFEHAGRYRVVSEFVHRDRAWIKHFDIDVGSPAAPQPAQAVKFEDTAGGYRARLDTGAAALRTGRESALEFSLERNGEAVTDLELHLGTELHGAVWREDGRYFGHLHSFTPKVAAIMQAAHERALEPAARGARIAEMMVQLMCLEADLVFPGPVVPVHYVFPAPGRYHLFLQVAPGGSPVAFHFIVEVA